MEPLAITHARNHVDLHGPGWTPAIIPQLGEVLVEFTEVFSKSSNDLGSILAPLRHFGSPVQLSRHVPALPHQSSDRQDSGRGFGQIPPRGPHPAFDITLGEPSGCHPDEIR